MFQGKFLLGVNYWASNAGIKMWTNFDIRQIEKDFAQLKEYGVNTIRMFPLWSEFQPIQALNGYLNSECEVRYTDDSPLEDTAEGIAGVSKVMVERMQSVLNLACKYEIQVILSLLTGWMSGRIFAPQPLMHRNLLTDPYAVKWEIRFIKFMVSRFKDSSAIIAWDLGNECNCMSPSTSPSYIYVWTHTVTSTIKQCDSTRPVMSGMPLGTPYRDDFSLREQGEILDILVSHPYNYYGENCMLDNPVSMRSLMHASMVTAVNRDISKKPAFVQEIGTYGPGFCNNSTAGRFARMHLFETLAQGYGGLLWWCAFDQDQLDYPPYDWCGHERELGMIKSDFTPKPVALEMKMFSQILKDKRLLNLKKPQRDAACLISRGNNTWNVALGSWALARQADMNITFWTEDQKLPESNIYMIPSGKNERVISKHVYMEILDKVKQGAVLYISFDEKMIISAFDTVCGVNVEYLKEHKATEVITFGDSKLTVPVGFINRFVPTTAESLAYNQDKEPVMFVNEYGLGKVVTLCVPLENAVASNGDFMSSIDADDYCSIYKYLMEQAGVSHVLAKKNRYILKTEHKTDESTIVICTNPTEFTQKDTFSVAGKKSIEKVYGEIHISGTVIEIYLESGDSVIFEIKN